MKVVPSVLLPCTLDERLRAVEDEDVELEVVGARNSPVERTQLVLVQRAQ